VARDPSEIVGTCLDDYRIEAYVADRSLATVYRAVQQSTGAVVEYELLAGEALDEQQLASFEAAARIHAGLTHDAIVRVLDVGRIDVHTPYVALEDLGGCTLAEFGRTRTLSVDEAIRLGLRLCAALQHVHTHGFVHNDIKPANISLPNGELGLATLGGFRLVERLGADAPRLIGTPRYMSPEQAQGLPRGAASDVWGLGVVLYECVVGRAIFGEGRSLLSLLQAIASEPIEWAPLPGGFDRVLTRALAKPPEQRFESMRAFAEALRQC
jgi:serine/threonine-protein kinase